MNVDDVNDVNHANHSLKIVQQAIAKQPTGVEVAFKTAIKPVLAKTLDAKRAEVGANLFRPVGAG